MKEKVVTQFICDFCGKKQYRKHVMVKHETHCTKNPRRSCRMCRSQDVDVRGAIQLAIPFTSPCGPEGEDWRSLKNDSISKVYEFAHGCPVCMIAILRQGKISSTFDYKSACKEWWNQNPRRDYYEKYPVE